MRLDLGVCGAEILTINLTVIVRTNRCGTNQTGNLLESTAAVDGLIGFGQAAISVPTQLADQGLVGHVFAHCLQGDTVGGGNIVIGNITEPGITYTPMVPGQ